MLQMVKVTLSVNGAQREVTAHPDTPLLWVLREQLKLTGTKYGCGVGQCGACTVHVEGKSAVLCLHAIKDVAGKSVLTIEGLSPDGRHPLQQAWVEGEHTPLGCRSPLALRDKGTLEAEQRGRG